MVAGTSVTRWLCHTQLPGCSRSRKLQWLQLIHPMAKQPEEGEGKEGILVPVSPFQCSCLVSHGETLRSHDISSCKEDRECDLLDGRECTQLEFDDTMHVCI